MAHRQIHTDHAPELATVCTVKEASKMYFVEHGTILYWINRGYINAENVGIWLISVKSLTDYRKPTRTIYEVRQHQASKEF